MTYLTTKHITKKLRLDTIISYKAYIATLFSLKNTPVKLKVTEPLIGGLENQVN